MKLELLKREVKGDKKGKSILFIHGMWHGAWCWEPTVSALRERGCDVTALDLALTDLRDDAEVLRSVLNGQKGPRRNVVIMNAAAALVASNMATDFTTGIRMAGEAIDSGRALGKMEDLIKLSQKLAQD